MDFFLSGRLINEALLISGILMHVYELWSVISGVFFEGETRKSVSPFNENFIACSIPFYAVSKWVIN